MSDSKRTQAQLLQGLLGPHGPELSCEQCFDLLDVYVEAETSSEEADLLVPGMRAHLQGCPACAEEHESLRALIAAGD
jgi:anti-sigma factor RsiW